jgi:hypothetical protein
MKKEKSPLQHTPPRAVTLAAVVFNGPGLFHISGSPDR